MVDQGSNHDLALNAHSTLRCTEICFCFVCWLCVCVCCCCCCCCCCCYYYVSNIVNSLSFTSYNMHTALHIHALGARCSSVVRAFAHGMMGRRIDPSWWTHWAISGSSQCSTTGITKAVVCVMLSVGWCI